MHVKSLLKALGKDDRGTSAVELGLICALIILAMLGAIQGFAGESIKMWETVKEKSDSAINGNQGGGGSSG